eukprot:CAMPEP_0184052842 /NCGR_PEP_ID=MMETSP0956-20121227/5565_1 /TAXON_ID=627963 /ORGANISM="Aplanochytrium sp, Strain PBS07" /LENGTH=192 /DNA_ID=CAMNT_0026346039 /DNA_START=107 /DNA_END=682 /DNA_ORIENTATION=+
MVRERKRKKPDARQDFKRVKAKVGRRIDKTKSKYGNKTDTSFKAKSLNLKDQLSESSNVKVKIAKLLPLTAHHSSSTRASALKGLTDIISNSDTLENASSRTVLPLIIDRVRLSIGDDDKSVRSNVVELICVLLEEGNLGEQHILTPFMDILLLHIVSALNDIKLNKRLHALELIDALLEYFPSKIYHEYES